VAQAFKLSSGVSICSVGIGLFLGQPNMPMTSISVYGDAGGVPGAALFNTSALSASPIASGEASPGSPADQTGTVGSFCQSSSGVDLVAGTYWAVAYWNSIPSNPSDAYLGVYGYSAPSKSGLPTMSSSDGTTWVDAGLHGGTQTLQLWVTTL
jgi:hypothetical protein